MSRSPLSSPMLMISHRLSSNVCACRWHWLNVLFLCRFERFRSRVQCASRFILGVPSNERHADSTNSIIQRISCKRKTHWTEWTLNVLVRRSSLCFAMHAPSYHHRIMRPITSCRNTMRVHKGSMLWTLVTLWGYYPVDCDPAASLIRFQCIFDASTMCPQSKSRAVH